MKTGSIIFGVLLMCGIASAYTTISVNQDKPDLLFVSSYTERDGGTSDSLEVSTDASGNAAADENGFTWYHDVRTGKNSVSWTNGAGGQGSWTWREVINCNLGSQTNTDWSTSSWPIGYYPNINGVQIDSDNPEGEPIGSPIILESCNLSVPYVDSSGSYTAPPTAWNATYLHFTEKDTGWRRAQATIKLQTGGKSGSRLRNLFGFNASATQHIPIKAPIGTYNPSNVPNQLVPIPRGNIIINNVGQMPATGTKYKVLPDDRTLDVTPYVPGVAYYTFDVSRQKYHSYFDVFVQQANPGCSIIPSSADHIDGHAFWQFRTDAPSDALDYVPETLTRFLYSRWGFYPTNNPPPVFSNGYTVPGFLNDDQDEPHNIRRTFYIGFEDMLNGLGFCSDIYSHPPNWSATGYNCVSAARTAGFKAGVFGLPWDMTPQNFGVMLVYMYPGPFEDATDIFYSNSPY